MYIISIMYNEECKNLNYIYYDMNCKRYYYNHKIIEAGELNEKYRSSY